MIKQCARLLIGLRAERLEIVCLLVLALPMGRFLVKVKIMPNMVNVGWLLNSIKNMRSSDMGKRLVCDSLTEMVINNTVDAEPVRHGHWVDGLDIPETERKKHPYVYLHGSIYCSACWHEAYYDTDYGHQLFDYCPFCGAIMDESEES